MRLLFQDVAYPAKKGGASFYGVVALVIHIQNLYGAVAVPSSFPFPIYPAAAGKFLVPW